MMTRFVMYRTPWCPFCVRARRLLDSLELPVEEIDVSGDGEKRAWLREVTGSHTVPQLFLDGKPIGGCDELYELHTSGQLKALLNEP